MQRNKHKNGLNRSYYSPTTLSIYDPRPEKIIFVKGDTMTTYANVVWAMDQARGAGVKVIGLAPK